MDINRTIRGITGLLLGCLFFFALSAYPIQPVSSPNFSSLPLYGKVIGVDPGHGGYDGGCVSITGVLEKEYNLKVSLLVGEKIKALGGTPIFTRETDIALIDPERTTGYKKRKELDNRIAILQEAQVDAMVSIHMNNYSVSKYRGAQVFYKGDSEEGKRLAESMQIALEKMEDPNLRAPAGGDYYILNACDAALLVECGFLSNPQEERLLASPDYQEKLAERIVEGLSIFFAESLEQDGG